MDSSRKRRDQEPRSRKGTSPTRPGFPWKSEPSRSRKPTRSGSPRPRFASERHRLSPQKLPQGRSPLTGSRGLALPIRRRESIPHGGQEQGDPTPVPGCGTHRQRRCYSSALEERQSRDEHRELNKASVNFPSGRQSNDSSPIGQKSQVQGSLHIDRGAPYRHKVP